MSTITTNIKGIRDVMRKDTGVDGDAQRISQMVWMLFMKIFMLFSRFSCFLQGFHAFYKIFID